MDNHRFPKFDYSKGGRTKRITAPSRMGPIAGVSQSQWYDTANNNAPVTQVILTDERGQIMTLWTDAEGNSIPFSPDFAVEPVVAPNQVFVVRLSGSAFGDSTARIEGEAILPGDLGSAFTLSGPYLSYSAQWLGGTLQDARLLWNDFVYTAGLGDGDAGYQHSSLPVLDSAGLPYGSEIFLVAESGAEVELRFTRPG